MKGIIAIIAIVGLLAMVSSCASVTVVDTGHRGIKTRFGNPEGPVLTEGVYFTSPFTESISEMDIRTQRIDGKTEAFSRDVQSAQVTYAVNVSLDSGHVVELFQTVGTDYAQRLIPPVVEGTLKSVFGQWDAVEVIANRDKLRGAVETAVRANLASRGINVERVEITNVDYSPQFRQAIEQKVTAIQNAETAKNHTVQIQEEANQRIIAAKAEAESIRVRSQALESSPKLIDYEAVRKWNGVLPTTTGGVVPFINLAK